VSSDPNVTAITLSSFFKDDRWHDFHPVAQCAGATSLTTIHCAATQISSGANPADNYWRTGNMLGAIELTSGIIQRVVRGAGADLAVNEPHPDTGRPLIGTPIPDWPRLVELVMSAATVFAGIRTQSWDVALSDQGPVFLEVNFGGDLNLAQLANGKGVLDEGYIEHLRECGYRI
jgi:hypothetical protein